MSMKNDEAIHKLKVGYVMDLKKPEVDRFERAQIIRSILDDQGMSVRSFAEKYGINRSTVEDWLIYERINEQEYRKLRDKGVSTSAIYDSLRQKKTEVPSKTEIDLFLYEVKRQCKHYKSERPAHSPRTVVLIEDAINELKLLMVHLKMSSKNK